MRSCRSLRLANGASHALLLIPSIEIIGLDNILHKLATRAICGYCFRREASQVANHLLKCGRDDETYRRFVGNSSHETTMARSVAELCREQGVTVPQLAE